jgi:signal transduction histidine kinase
MRWFPLLPLRPGSYRKRRGPLRAKRHSLQLPVQYRARGQNTWKHGTTENISCTGALFTSAAEPLNIGQEVELRLELPRELAGPAEVALLCEAEVVRVETPARAGTRMKIGAAVSRYRLEEPQTSLARKNPPRRSLREIRHDLNNALMAIVGCSELLLMQNAEDAFVRSQLETIREYALRAGIEVQQLQSGAA